MLINLLYILADLSYNFEWNRLIIDHLFDIDYVMHVITVKVFVTYFFFKDDLHFPKDICYSFFSLKKNKQNQTNEIIYYLGNTCIMLFRNTCIWKWNGES